MSLWDVTKFLINPFKDPNKDQKETEESFQSGMGEVYPDIGKYVPDAVEKAFADAAQVPAYSEPYRAKLLETIRSYFPQASNLLQETAYVPTYTQGIKQEAAPSAVYLPPSFQTPQYTKAPQWRDSRYYEAGGDIGDITNHPSFKAFESALTGALSSRSQQIADEMAKRGILSSGASKQAYEDLAASAQQAIANEMGQLAQKPIEAALIEKYVNEPKRRTEFESAQNQAQMKYLADEAARRSNFMESEAARESDFGKWLSEFLTKQSQEDASRQDTMNRWFGDIRQREADREQQARENNLGQIIDIAKAESGAEKEYQDASRNLAVKNWALRMDALKDPVDLLMHVVSGGTSPLGSKENALKAAFAADFLG